MDKVTINYGGQTVDCYGTWEWDSNCLVVGWYADGTELEEIYADGGVDWYDVVRRLVDAPVLQGAEIVELQAC